MKRISDVTHVLARWSQGDSGALKDLMPLIVDDLRGMAARQMVIERTDHTLQPTALVNEIYLKFLKRRSVSWRNRAQFFAVVAGMMRRLLVDYARGQQATRRGGDRIKLSLDDQVGAPNPAKDPDLVALDAALNTLETLEPRQARMVEMRYFIGLTVEDIAAIERVSMTTVKREWRTARMWLFKELKAA